MDDESLKALHRMVERAKEARLAMRRRYYMEHGEIKLVPEPRQPIDDLADLIVMKPGQRWVVGEDSVGMTDLTQFGTPSTPTPGPTCNCGANHSQPYHLPECAILQPPLCKLGGKPPHAPDCECATL